MCYFLWFSGLTLSHGGVSIQASTGKTGTTVMQTAPSTESQIAHIVGQHAPLAGLTPMTVVSQGNQVTAHILAPTSLAGKMLTTPILKSVGQVPLVNAQYINTTTLVKPVVVVSTSNSNTSAPTSIASSTQPSVTTQSNVWQSRRNTWLVWKEVRQNSSLRYSSHFFICFINKQKLTHKLIAREQSELKLRDNFHNLVNNSFSVYFYLSFH